MLKMKSYSQNNQDLYIYKNFFKRSLINKIFNNKIGFFVEIGADDGIHNSNTLLFENLGWKGLCIEPSPVRFQSLKKNRKCDMINVALSNKEGKMKFLDIQGYGKGLSGIIENYDPLHLKRIEKETTENPKTKNKEVIEVDVVRFDKVLQEKNIKTIDYCSIDVEGSEINILNTIDFDKVYIKIISIEDNYENPEIINILEKNNFSVVKKLGGDLIFKNNKFTP